MCDKKDYGKDPVNSIDSCMREEINNLQKTTMKTLGCCCGHGKYPKTIVIELVDGRIMELESDKMIPRTRNFYKSDKEGYYYIPEVSG